MHANNSFKLQISLNKFLIFIHKSVLMMQARGCPEGQNVSLVLLSNALQKKSDLDQSSLSW